MSAISNIHQQGTKVLWDYSGIPCEVETELPLLQVTEFINQLDPEIMQEFYAKSKMTPVTEQNRQFRDHLYSENFGD